MSDESRIRVDDALEKLSDPGTLRPDRLAAARIVTDELERLRGEGNNVLGFDASKIPRESLLMAHGYAFGLAMRIKALGLELSESNQAMGTRLYAIGTEAQLTMQHFAGVHHSKPEPQAPDDEHD